MAAPPVYLDECVDRPVIDGLRQHSGILLIPEVPPVNRRVVRAAMLLDWLGTLEEYRSRLFQWNDLQARLLRAPACRGIPRTRSIRQ